MLGPSRDTWQNEVINFPISVRIMQPRAPFTTIEGSLAGAFSFMELPSTLMATQSTPSYAFCKTVLGGLWLGD